MYKNLAILAVVLIWVQTVHAESKELCSLKSPDGLNAIYIALSSSGELSYRVERRGNAVILESPMGLKCKGQDFSKGLAVHEIGEVQSGRETYQLLTGNTLKVDKVLNKRTVSLKTESDSKFLVDLAAADDGVAFRYRLQGAGNSDYTINAELTGFKVPLTADAWLEPYHQANSYTPAYEDFYYQVRPGDLPKEYREKPRGWCLPALFHSVQKGTWMLIAESGTDDSYCACHLETDKSIKSMYRIAFAYEDEVTAAKSFKADANTAPVLSRNTPWRAFVMGDKAGDIITSTLVTDLAAPSKISDTSWIKAGRASWSWWSNPSGHSADLYNKFTDMAAEFKWEYTLFDAGWWNADLKSLCQYADSKGVKPLVWAHAVDFYDAKQRQRKLDEFAAAGVKGIKVDFWCSDRQEAIGAMSAMLRDAADRKLVVSLHGCTIPRGWQRTWPNLLTAEGVLGTECYFCEPRYPEKAAQLNTILPFTRNILSPMDITPFALTIKQYPRRTTAAFELATSIIGTSGIIHYADSVEVYSGLPHEVKEVLKEAPAAWDETRCLKGDPGKVVVLARRSGKKWFVAGLNGTDRIMPVALDLKKLGNIRKVLEISEGQDPIMQFSTKNTDVNSKWQHKMPKFGGFVLCVDAED